MRGAMVALVVLALAGPSVAQKTEQPAVWQTQVGADHPANYQGT